MNNAYIVTLMYFSSIEVLVSDGTMNKKCTLTPKPLPCKWLTQYLPWWQCIVVCVCVLCCVINAADEKYYGSVTHFWDISGGVPHNPGQEKRESKRKMTWQGFTVTWVGFKWGKSVLFQLTRNCIQNSVRKKCDPFLINLANKKSAWVNIILLIIINTSKNWHY